MKITKIYDNPKYADRYTVYFDIKEYGNKFMCLSMSSEPFHPQGICCHSTGMLGEHNGKEITFSDLPKDCQVAVNNDLK